MDYSNKIARAMLATAIAVVAAVASPLHGIAKDLSFDLRPAERSAKALEANSASSDGILREFDLADRSVKAQDLAVGDALRFALFDDVTVKVVLKSRMHSAFGGEIFSATVEGCGDAASAVVIADGDALTVDVNDFANRRAYKVISHPGGVKVQEASTEKKGACACCAKHEVTDSGKTLVANAVKEPEENLANVSIDMLVAYDANAAKWAQSNGGGITNFAQMAVAKMNTVLENGGLRDSFYFRLVGVTAISASTTDLNVALDNVTNGRSGWAPIKTERDRTGADIVTVLVDTGSAYGDAGLSWGLRTTDYSSFAPNAYNVCAIRSVAISHTMTHEVGHNLGAGHSDAMADKSNCGPQLFNYSSGYYLKNVDVPVSEGSTWVSSKNFHTVMSYSDDGYGNTYEEIPYFSSASVQYVVNGKGLAVGDDMHDNTRTIANTYLAASRWRSKVVPDYGEITFIPASGTAFTSELEVVLECKDDFDVRYTLDGSDPVATSPLFTRPIIISATTTVKAATFVNGSRGFIYEAHYTKGEYSTALGPEGHTWKVSDPGTIWQLEHDLSVDGLAIRADATSGTIGKNFWLETDVPADAKGFSYEYQYDAEFIRNITADSSYIDSSWHGGFTCQGWETDSFDLPAGTRKLRIEFTFEESCVDGNFICLDNFRFLTVATPVLSPKTSIWVGEEYRFEDEMMFSISTGFSGDTIYYTLDGSDPLGEGAMVYDGPVFINENTYVRAIAVAPGEPSPSVEVKGYYQKIIPEPEPAPGVWLGDSDGALDAAGDDGSMVAIVLMNTAGCFWSQAFVDVLDSDEFLAWAKMNGLYLVNTDDGWDDHPYDSDNSLFWSLYQGSELEQMSGGSAGYPTVVVADPATRSRIGAFLARNDEESSVNGLFYEDTAESLIAIFESFLGKQPLAAPEPTYSGMTVALSNPNTAGEIYYTLDGSAPFKETATRYTGPVEVPFGVTLTAVVWLDDASEPSGVPFVFTRTTDTEKVGVPGMEFVNDTAVPWELGTAYGEVEGRERSTLTARVAGPGMLRFQTSWGSTAKLSLYVGGEEIYGDCGSNSYIEYEITNPDGAEIIWKYEPYTYYSEPYACIYNLSWTTLPEVPQVRAERGNIEYGALIRWDAVEGATKYIVYRAEMDDATTAEEVATTVHCRYWDASSKDGSRYWYFVKAVGNYGQSGYSDGVRAGVDATQVTFDANGGVGGWSRTMDAGADLTAPVVTREGYVFAGWEPEVPAAVPAVDAVTYTAKWLVAMRMSDSYANAATLPGNEGRLAGSTVGATVEAGEFCAQTYDSVATVWCKFTAPGTGLVRLRIPESDFDTVLAVCTGQQLKTAEVVTFNDDEDKFTERSALAFDVESGKEYRIAVGGYEYEAGSFVLDWSYTPASELVKVVFDAQGGEVSTPRSLYEPGEALEYIPEPERPDYRWEGWYTEPEGDRLVDETWRVPDGGATLYAQWSEVLHWLDSVSEALAEAKATGRYIFLLSGSENDDDDTLETRIYTCEEPEVRSRLKDGYVLLYCDFNRQKNDIRRYLPAGASIELPFMAVVNPFTNSALSTGDGYQDAAGITAILDGAGNPPGPKAFSLEIAAEEKYETQRDGSFTLDIDEVVESYFTPKVTVSGLPAGIKFDSKKLVISGTATAPGRYTVRISATNEIVKNPVVAEFELKVPNLLPEAFERAGLEDEYSAYAGVAPDLTGVIAALVADGWKLAAAGLPAGLKYDARSGAITGIATKAGSFTVKLTATRGREKEIATATFIVEFPVLAIEKEMLSGGAATDAVTGAGAYPADKKITLKATPAKGHVFAGWHTADGEPLAGALDYRTASYAYVTTDEDVVLVAKFASAEEDASISVNTEASYTCQKDGSFSLVIPVESITVPKLSLKGLPAGLKFDAKTNTISGKAAKPGVYTVTVSATNTSVKKAASFTFRLEVPNFESPRLPGLKPGIDDYGVLRCGVALDHTFIDCTVTDGYTLKVSGLPSGLKFDAKTGLVTGVPTKAGSFTVTFTATKKGAANEVATITLNVADLPAWVVGTFNGAVVSGSDTTGLVESFTIAKNGKTTGKIQHGGLVYTANAASLASVEENVSGSGPLFRGEVVMKAGSGKTAMISTNTFTVAALNVTAGGKVIESGVITMAHDDDAASTTYAWRNLWKDEPFKTLAKTLAKHPAITLAGTADGLPADGDTITLKFGSNGTLKASAIFTALNTKTNKPQNYSASCSATLIPVPDEPGAYVAYVYFAPKAGTTFDKPFAMAIDIR